MQKVYTFDCPNGIAILHCNARTQFSLSVEYSELRDNRGNAIMMATQWLLLYVLPKEQQRAELGATE